MSDIINYQPEFFILEELVSKPVWKEYGSGAWDLLDSEMLKTIDDLRRFLGAPITINNWYRGGDRSQSGYRGFDSNIGGRHSQHRYGRAVDMLVKGINSEDVRGMIINSQCLFPFIQRMEKDVSWVHIDGKPNSRVNGNIYLFGA